jgi:uncharacterized damage-inducible protein DinB
MNTMDLLDRFLGHDVDTTREMLRRCRDLSDEHLDRRFAIGHGSLRATFHHTIWNIEAWTDLMIGRARRDEPDPAERLIETMIARLDAIYGDFAAMAKRVQAEGRMDDMFADVIDDPPRMKTFGSAIVHVITHSMHHRAQVLNIMRQLGMTNLIEGDAESWERDRRADGWPVMKR